MTRLPGPLHADHLLAQFLDSQSYTTGLKLVYIYIPEVHKIHNKFHRKALSLDWQCEAVSKETFVRHGGHWWEICVLLLTFLVLNNKLSFTLLPLPGLNVRI